MCFTFFVVLSRFFFIFFLQNSLPTHFYTNTFQIVRGTSMLFSNLSDLVVKKIRFYDSYHVTYLNLNTCPYLYRERNDFIRTELLLFSLGNVVRFTKSEDISYKNNMLSRYIFIILSWFKRNLAIWMAQIGAVKKKEETEIYQFCKLPVSRQSVLWMCLWYTECLKFRIESRNLNVFHINIVILRLIRLLWKGCRDATQLHDTVAYAEYTEHLGLSVSHDTCVNQYLIVSISLLSNV